LIRCLEVFRSMKPRFSLPAIRVVSQPWSWYLSTSVGLLLGLGLLQRFLTSERQQTIPTNSNPPAPHHYSHVDRLGGSCVHRYVLVPNLPSFSPPPIRKSERTPLSCEESDLRVECELVRMAGLYEFAEVSFNCTLVFWLMTQCCFVGRRTCRICLHHRRERQQFPLKLQISYAFYNWLFSYCTSAVLRTRDGPVFIHGRFAFVLLVMVPLTSCYSGSVDGYHCLKISKLISERRNRWTGRCQSCILAHSQSYRR